MSQKKQLLSVAKSSKPSKFSATQSTEVAPEAEVAAAPEVERANLNFADPRSFAPQNLLALQRSLGNRAVQRLIATQKGQSAHQIARTPLGTSPRGVIQRHASHEHKMLGDVDPAALEIIAASSNIKKGGTQAVQGVNDAALTIHGGANDGQVITKDMVLHTLMQEINRIKFFRDNPPREDETRTEYRDRLKVKDKNKRGRVAKENTTGTKGQIRQAVTQAMAPEWDVVIVSIPNSKGGAPLLVSYGEMNTLADIYGNVEELSNADPKNRWEVLQGIRQLSLFNYMNIYEKVAGKGVFNSKANSMRVGEGFKGATGVTGRGGGTIGELRFILGGKKKKGDNKELDYTAGLGRNACHFAPESWYSWAKYHRDGLVAARQAYVLGQQLQGVETLIGQNSTQALVTQKHDLEDQKDEKENDALLANGFGDHFLQDSYAAGHLINKTQVMKWFVEWMDNHPYQADFTKDENWRKNQAIAYDQDTVGQEDDRYDITNVGGGMTAKDPQSVENMKDDNQTNWVSRFNAIGLKLPLSVNPGSDNFKFTLWWQGRAANWYRTRGIKLSDVPDEFNAVAIDAIKLMIQEGVARVNWTGSKDSRQVIKDWTAKDWQSHSFLLNPDYVPKSSKDFQQLVNRMSSQNLVKSQKAKEEYKLKGAKVTYKNYHEFLGNSLLQAGTNILHNHFCNNGITVRSGEGVDLGRIYGDYKMLAKDSSVGVKYSATTSHMSRDAIIQTYTNGAEDGGYDTQSIANRFPTQATLVDKNGGETGGMVPLDQWSTGLKALLDNKIFGEAQNSLPARAGGIKGNDLGKISKDTEVHSGNIF